MTAQTKQVPRREAHREKVTVTLRTDRVLYADRKAKEQGVSRSELIDALLAEAEEREIAALMIAGYQALAQENFDLADEGSNRLERDSRTMAPGPARR